MKMRSTFAEIAVRNAFEAASTTDPRSAFAASALPERSDESVLVRACPSWSPLRPWRVADNAVRACEPCAFTLPQQHGRDTLTLPQQRGRHCAFTLVELLVVTAIIGSLMVLVAPAFTSIKSAGDVTNADPIDATRLVQVTRLVKIENLHLPLFTVGSGTGDTFDMRLLFSSPQAESVTMIPDLLIVSSANLSVSASNNRRTRK